MAAVSHTIPLTVAAEQGAIGLEECLAEYRRGVALARRCGSILETAEQELKQIKAGEIADNDPSAARSP